MSEKTKWNRGHAAFAVLWDGKAAFFIPQQRKSSGKQRVSLEAGQEHPQKRPFFSLLDGFVLPQNSFLGQDDLCWKKGSILLPVNISQKNGGDIDESIQHPVPAEGRIYPS
ncbi:hypothetical protein [Angelakisella massiliensis]|uniref:hypothetical protein n=1 Tax=Angelakisella massiliensis TaxID=1871018 RepID=UPI001113DDCB|nr:hypothetical protein [Angelakisella massiliensis]